MRNKKIAENCVSAFRQALEVAGDVFAKQYIKLANSGNPEHTDIADFREMLHDIGKSAKAVVINDEDVKMTAVCTIDIRDEDCDCMDDEDESTDDERYERLNDALDRLVVELRNMRK